MPSDESRFELVSRRAMLKRSLIVGSLVAIPGLACSPSDKEVFAKSTVAPGMSTSTPVATSSTTSSTTPAARTTTTAATRPTRPSTTTATTTGPLLAASSQLAIAFAFAPAASGGRIHNPFIAVWIEDASGALVRTVSLWYKSSESKYLNGLRRWYAAERASIARGGTDTTLTISGATRVAGSYSVVWDAKNDSGALVPQGDYFVCIEAARERGPYELIRDSLSLGTKALQKKLADSGELIGASASFGG